MKLFPFNLTGPHFLWFFIFFGLFVVMTPFHRRRTSPADDDDAPLPHLTNPIEIAALRGGYEEAARLTLIVLHDRGLIKQDGATFRSLGAADGTREPLETAVFQYFRDGLPPTDLLKDAAVRRIGRKIESSLELRGLRVPAARRAQVFCLSLAALGMVAGLRIWISGIVAAASIVPAS
jgi:uncharacterized protein (TIGR04222 family)